MKVITSGSSYIDIDAYACIIALAELYNKCGEAAIGASSVPLNESITAGLKALDVAFKKDYTPNSEDEFVLVDVSFPKYFDPIVDLDRVVGVIDHHPGHEEYWNDRIGSEARIESIGAACTQVFEEWQSRDMLRSMSSSSAKLLASGILDNTLDFGAEVSTQRDIDAYEKLALIADLPKEWPAQYFAECQRSVEYDLKKAIRNDTKMGMQNLPAAVGQLIVWDAEDLVDSRFADLSSVMREKSEQWLLNIIDISKGCSILVATDSGVKAQIAELLDTTFDGSTAKTDRMWLRKEILKEALKG